MLEQGKALQTTIEYLEWNLALEKLEGFFPLKYAISMFGKRLNYSILGFQRGHKNL